MKNRKVTIREDVLNTTYKQGILKKLFPTVLYKSLEEEFCKVGDFITKNNIVLEKLSLDYIWNKTISMKNKVEEILQKWYIVTIRQFIEWVGNAYPKLTEKDFKILNMNTI